MQKSFTVFEQVASGQPPRQAQRPFRALESGEVLVRVAGCGLCHTDVGYAFGGVKTRKPLPLVLGHEISGVVEDAGSLFAGLVGAAIVVPAVLPCGECRDCKAGRSGICTKQVMPGNDADGGFGTHSILPGRGLCRVPGASADFDARLGQVPGLTLRHLSVVADAVSTAFQSVLRAGLGAGDLAVVVGLGGVGGYAAQIAADGGASVVGLEVDRRRLSEAAARGVLALDPTEFPSPKDLRKRVMEHAKGIGATTAWKIFECSGSAAGQQSAFGLLVPGATLMVVGYTMAETTLRLSNLMAFDARAIGNWGCAPEHYPAILEKVLAGKIDVVTTSELRPLSALASAFDDVQAHRASRRIVLTPDV